MKTINVQQCVNDALFCQTCGQTFRATPAGNPDAVKYAIREHMKMRHPNATGAMYWTHEIVKAGTDNE